MNVAKETSSEMYNKRDRQIWDKIFSAPPMDWKKAPAIPQIKDCIETFQKFGLKTLVDFGCGPGYWATHLAKAGFVVSGFDFSEAAISYAKRWAEEEKLSLDFRCAPVTQNPFLETRFDGVLATLILDNLSKDECKIAVGEIYKSVKTKGLVFALFNPLMTEDMKKTMEIRNNPTKDITSISYAENEILMLFSDFQVVEFKTFMDGTRGLYASKSH